MLRRSAAVAAALASLALPASAAAAPAGLRLGFTDIGTFQSGEQAMRTTGLAHAKGAGAQIARLYVGWSDVAPTRPPTTAAAADPSWSGYRWAALDAVLRDVAAAGLEPLPFVLRAPGWAEGAGRPAVSRSAPSGSWRPSPSDFAAFATAIAKRYSGRQPDPLDPARVLPRVRYWQAWNEPNLADFITPQWRRGGGRPVPESPRIYRGLLNAFYGAVKAVDATNLVVTAGTAPFGDLKDGDPRMPPARFWRELLCVKGRTRPKRTSCPGPVRFDVAAHHPYPIGPPRRRARNVDDIVVPDLAKLTKPLAVALRSGVVLPKRSKQIWATELSWDSRPDPDGLSLADQAQYLAGALYVLWRQGVDAVTWWMLRDQAPRPSYATTYQSGIFMRSDAIAADVPKPSHTAFRFPFTAYRSGGVARLWGLAPAPGAPVVIEARSGDRWSTVATLRAASNRVYTGRLRVGRGTQLRARQGADVSLAWTAF